MSFGWSSVVPVPADYDGNGVTDLAVYDPAVGTWCLATGPWSNGRREGPASAGDYDGDGADTPSLPANGTWQIT